MLEKFKTLLEEINSSELDRKATISKVQSVLHQVSVELETDGKILNLNLKHNNINTIKKYDVIHVKTFNSVHYMLVYSVKKGIVHGVTISSKNYHYVVHTIEHDRIFVGSYATNCILSFPIEEAKERFTRVYENKKEADVIFRKIKLHYKNTLNL